MRTITIAAFLAAATVALLCVSCARPAAPPAARSTAQKEADRIAARSEEYVGGKACAPCHRSEFESQSRTHHAHSLQLAAAPADALVAAPDGPTGGAGYRIRRANGAVYFDMPQSGNVELTGAANNGSLPLKFAIGSGVGGVTYATPLDADHLLVFRESYFPRRHLWHVTPRTEDIGENDPGMVISGDDAQTCVGCHSINAPRVGINPTKETLGVQCESCHGPGGAHLEAMKLKRRDDLHIAIQRGKSAREFVALCGGCHNADPQPGEVDANMQPTGASTVHGIAAAFALSRCYQNGESGLSCVTCHAPHADVSQDHAGYDAVCRSCHGGKEGREKRVAHTTTAPLCPAKPQGDCISCHMPRYRVTPDKTFPWFMTNHHIAIYRNATVR